MPRKTPPFPNYPEWTTARFFGFIRSGLREKFNRYPPKYQTLQAAAATFPVLDPEGNQVTFKTGKSAGKPKFQKQYLCASCGKHYPQKQVNVDHIHPAGQLKSFDDLPTFCERLFCGPDGLQVLCKDCHDVKTKEEKAK